MVSDPGFLWALVGALITAIGLVVATISSYRLSTRKQPEITEIKTLMSSLSGDIKELARAYQAAPTSPSGSAAEKTPQSLSGSIKVSGGTAAQQPESVASADISKRLDELLKRIPERLQDAELKERQVEVAKATAALKMIELSRYSQPLVEKVWARVENFARLLDRKGMFPEPIKILSGKAPRDLMLSAKDVASGTPMYNPHKDNLRIQFPSAGEWWLMLLFGWVAYPGVPNPGDAHQGTDFRLPYIQLSRFPKHQLIPNVDSPVEFLRVQLLPESRIEVKPLMKPDDDNVKRLVRDYSGFDLLDQLLVHYVEPEIVQERRTGSKTGM